MVYLVESKNLTNADPRLCPTTVFKKEQSFTFLSENIDFYRKSDTMVTVGICTLLDRERKRYEGYNQPTQAGVSVPLL